MGRGWGFGVDVDGERRARVVLILDDVTGFDGDRYAGCG